MRRSGATAGAGLVPKGIEKQCMRMNGEMMEPGMMIGMGMIWVLILGVLVLGVLALIKYLRS